MLLLNSGPSDPGPAIPATNHYVVCWPLRVRHSQSFSQVRSLPLHPAYTDISSRFLRDQHDDGSTKSWNEQLAEKYYANLYREFAVCDLKHFKSGNVSPFNRVPSLSPPFSSSSLPSAGEPKTKCCLAQARRPVQIPAASITTNPKLLCPPLNFPLPTKNTEKQNRP